MSERPAVDWIGASGEEYTYYIFEFPFNFSASQNGNYIFTKVNAKNEWVPIYIGQGDLKERTENHHQATGIARKGATHIHAHVNPGKEDRIAEEQDLLENYTNAYQPTGCNEKEGG
jgi:hypothetical protein